MVWVAVFLMLAVIGSVFWLRPSPRDRRLADLRFEAIKAGMVVKQLTFTPESAKNGIRDPFTGTTYSLLSDNVKAPKTLMFRIIQQAGWDTKGLPEGFSWHDQPAAQDDDWFQQLNVHRLIEASTDQIKMIEVYGNRVTLMAAEDQGASADNYQQLLQPLMDAVKSR